jgi:hypothetical protein
MGDQDLTEYQAFKYFSNTWFSKLPLDLFDNYVDMVGDGEPHDGDYIHNSYHFETMSPLMIAIAKHLNVCITVVYFQKDEKPDASGSATMGYYSKQQKCLSVTYGAVFEKSGEARCYAGRDIFLEIHPSFIKPLIPKPHPVASHNYRQKLLWDDFWDKITTPVHPPPRVASKR